MLAKIYILLFAAVACINAQLYRQPCGNQACSAPACASPCGCGAALSPYTGPLEALLALAAPSASPVLAPCANKLAAPALPALPNLALVPRGVFSQPCERLVTPVIAPAPPCERLLAPVIAPAPPCERLIAPAPVYERLVTPICAPPPPSCGCVPELALPALPTGCTNPFLPAASPVSAMAPQVVSPLLPPVCPCENRNLYLRKIPIPPPCI